MVPKTAESKTPMSEENKYELMVILLPDLSADDTEKELKDIRKLLKEANGEIYHEDIWNIRNLAYTIKKQDRGFYAIFYFTLEAAKLKEIDKSLSLNQKVIRHMIVKSPKGYVIKSLSELELTEEERKRTAKKPLEKETKVETAEVKVKAKVETEKEPAAKKKDEKPMDIADLDSKLSSILDDSDLNMKL